MLGSMHRRSGLFYIYIGSATAKRNGLEPYALLEDTLEKLPTWPYSRIDELLPLRKETPD